MINIDVHKVAVDLLNTTLGLENIPLEIHGRIATALILLDQQDGENFYSALEDAYGYIGKDKITLEDCLEGLENGND